MAQILAPFFCPKSENLFRTNRLSGVFCGIDRGNWSYPHYNLVPRLSLHCLHLSGCGWSRYHLQNLGSKKICWAEGVTVYFDCCFGKLGGFQNLEQSLKTTGTRSFRILPMKNATPLLPSPKYRRISRFRKIFGSRMEHKVFGGSTEVKPVNQFLESLRSP